MSYSNDTTWERTMSDLRTIHSDVNIDPGKRGAIIAGIVLALVILVLAGFGWQAGWFHVSREPVPFSRLPQASMPLNMPAKN
jgi:hypothetical protein